MALVIAIPVAMTTTSYALYRWWTRVADSTEPIPTLPEEVIAELKQGVELKPVAATLKFESVLKDITDARAALKPVATNPRPVTLRFSIRAQRALLRSVPPRAPVEKVLSPLHADLLRVLDERRKQLI